MAQENRTEKATPYRRKKLREEGNVAKSPELASSLTVFLSSVILFFVGGYLFYEVVKFMQFIVENPSMNPTVVVKYVGERFPGMLLPLFSAALLTVVLAHVGQFGFIFTLKPLQFKWERLNPFEGIKRVFSLTTAFELVKNVLKVSLFMVVSYFILRGDVEELLTAPSQDVSGFVLYMIKLVFKLILVLSAFAMLIALLDYGYRRWDYERRIRMSKEEVKEEYKQHEGNPQIKGAIKKRMRQLSRGRMMKEVPKASVVITNPTHIAIALRYNPEEGDRAPKVLAKGKGPVAEKIVEIAHENGVPVIRKEELARGMYPLVEVGEEIPPKFYRAVAEVIAFIMFRKKRVAV
ncbi:MAG: flagellar biosynthesis protein FlhB [Aquificaceae bacterium]|jgi:flagellar biosynthetic protein FlhB|uniref:flagellar biosynthesis protein FlhB n=1 Tax=Hydrogenobacter sp. Uz 6-8 TaxID=3384828 RepID=UPI000F0E6A38|nr:MAG: flagellar biosynthesis protein FlhB [Aquificota bacterium]